MEKTELTFNGRRVVEMTHAELVKALELAARRIESLEAQMQSEHRGFLERVRRTRLGQATVAGAAVLVLTAAAPSPTPSPKPAAAVTKIKAKKPYGVSTTPIPPNAVYPNPAPLGSPPPALPPPGFDR